MAKQTKKITKTEKKAFPKAKPKPVNQRQPEPKKEPTPITDAIKDAAGVAPTEETKTTTEETTTEDIPGQQWSPKHYGDKPPEGAV